MALFGKKLKISDETFDLVEKAVAISGASSVEEFVEQILTKESEQIINQAGKGAVSQEEIDDISNKLKGLGYLE